MGERRGSSIPGRFTLLVNRRCPRRSGSTSLELERTVAEALNGSGAPRLDDPVVGHLLPVSDPTGPHWPRWQAALSEGFGWPIESFRAWGASSLRYGLGSSGGDPGNPTRRLTRPGCGAHGADEHTTLDDVMALAKSISLPRCGFPGAEGASSVNQENHHATILPSPSPFSGRHCGIRGAVGLPGDRLAQARRGGTLRVSTDQAPSKLNPLLHRVNPEYVLGELLYSGLTRLGPAMEAEPDQLCPGRPIQTRRSGPSSFGPT